MNIGEDKMDEESHKKNRKVAKEGSWLHALFLERQLNLKDKQEILRRVYKDFKIKEQEELLQGKV